MNDDQKNNEQLIEELAQERERSNQAEERSLALQEVSKRVAAAHDTDEVLDLIVNEAARLVGAPTVIIRLLDGDVLVIRAATEGLSRFSEAVNRPSKVEEGANLAGHVMATKKPLFGEEVVPLHLPEILRAIEKEGDDPAAGGCRAALGQ